ncbi:3-oxoacyl-[acyl-carrier protein] reductase [Geosmithia morbida]|uniref:3-oxoacyl-[acyl-carrier protein] reductase n=1 Tax=Geosmithia morbida TaxID=1094350 RepID=A0A9P4YLV1_9HYPO|nr:3-oxoacyl-[acyl-carrier protein] reductase [Geosmithia morbida]KAF4119361.1 3-oxoacyl-[acyl-carrier protein] reductase [Geosmithia morbida]
MPVDTLSLEGKVAIVTGSGRENGIGAGVALALARNGASVVVHYVSDSVADRAAKVCDMLRQAGGQAIVVQAAVDTLDGARLLVAKTLEGFKTDRIDILVNNAGVGFLTPITQEPNPEELARMMSVNVLGPFYMVNSVTPHMPRGGRIINVSSTAAVRGNPAISIYAASKAALENLTWTWAEELGVSKGITVNSVAPGPVFTDIYPEGTAEQMSATEISLTRIEKRAGTIEDIGDSVLLLVNEKSRWITGQNVGVNGGVSR